ncbi:MAG: tRNA pseudouridine(65) synthase TruC [Oceanospirillales bacterium]|nr:tRNA pseudouridine(65) synthase TruC [Oceanospirillales bacterium]
MSDPNPTVDSQPQILFEDDWIIAVDKPAGLLVHPSWIAPAKTPNLVSWLRERYPGEKIHTVHRLDRATSGVILFTRNKDVAHALQTAFSERQVLKRYLCVVRGWTDEFGEIDYALKPIHDRIADAHANPDKPAQEAVSSFRRLGCVELPIAIGRYPVARYSLVEVCPKTGRKHQIRRHMKHIFHPLVGDTKHGEGRHNRLFREHFGLHRLLLMATEITFTHPVTKEEIAVKAPVSDEVDRLFSEFGWQGLYPAPVRGRVGGTEIA